MKLDRDFLTSPTGQVALVAAVLLLGVLAVRGQRKPPVAPLPAAKPAPSAVLPQTLIREGAKLTPPPLPVATIATAPSIPSLPKSAAVPPELPLTLFTAPADAPKRHSAPTAPYGRMIPCQTVVALESNHLDTPIIGLVTEDVWHNGRRVIPAGAEVHGRAALDRTRERIGAAPQWHIVWRTTDTDNGSELAVDGIVLDRDYDPTLGSWGDHDGSAGLRGQLVKADDERELKLFAATFLASATAALQDNKLANGLFGETSVPAATARNAVLNGTGAILREYAQSMREAIARDGFFLRVPAGKPFYLYVTQTIDRSQTARATSIAQTVAR